MKTGNDVHYEGTYISECCNYETRFTKHQTFTRCPKCSALTVWETAEDDELLKAA